MTQLITIDRVTLEQLVRMLEQCLDDAIQVQCDLEQGYSKSPALAQMVQVELSKEALTAGRAALVRAERVEPDTQLCKFYDVATYPDLVAAMEKHITKLQARTPPLTGEAFTQKPRFAWPYVKNTETTGTNGSPYSTQTVSVLAGIAAHDAER